MIHVLLSLQYTAHVYVQMTCIKEMKVADPPGRHKDEITSARAHTQKKSSSVTSVCHELQIHCGTARNLFLFRLKY